MPRTPHVSFRFALVALFVVAACGDDSASSSESGGAGGSSGVAGAGGSTAEGTGATAGAGGSPTVVGTAVLFLVNVGDQTVRLFDRGQDQTGGELLLELPPRSAERLTPDVLSRENCIEGTPCIRFGVEGVPDLEHLQIQASPGERIIHTLEEDQLKLYEQVPAPAEDSASFAYDGSGFAMDVDGTLIPLNQSATRQVPGDAVIYLQQGDGTLAPLDVDNPFIPGKRYFADGNAFAPRRLLVCDIADEAVPVRCTDHAAQ